MLITLNLYADLNKDKYQRYYHKWTTIRDDLEKEALAALDSGRTKQFEEIAESMHSAAEIVEQFKVKLHRTNKTPKSKNNVNNGKKPQELEKWASFSVNDNDGNLEDGATDNVNGGRNELKSEALGQTYGGRQYLDLCQVGRGITRERRNANHPNVDKFSSGSLALPINCSRSTSISLHASSDRNSIDRIGKYDNYNEADNSGHAREPPKISSAASQRVAIRNIKGKEVDNPRPPDTNRMIGVNHTQRKQRDAVMASTNRGKHVYNGPTTSEADDEFKHRSNKVEGFNKVDITRHAPSLYDEKHERLTTGAEGEIDLALYMMYSKILEKCIMLIDSDILGPRLMGKTLQEKILMSTRFVDTHNGGYRREVSFKPGKKMLKGEDDGALKAANTNVGTKPITESLTEPLWRVKEDGGVSEYIGKYLAKGGTLFDGILFMINLSLDTIQVSSEAEVHVEVLRKMHSVEITTGLCGHGTDTIKIIKRSATAFTFRCDPATWTYSFPSLVVKSVESDGTKREFIIKAPIGPSIFLQPLDISQDKINRIMKNNSNVGFYTMHKIFAPRNKLEMSSLLAALSKNFHINKTNTKHTLAAVDNHDEIIVATLHNEGKLIVVQSWSPSEKLISSACSHVKEIAAYLSVETNEKLADMAMRSCNIFPLEFEKDTRTTHTTSV